MEDKVNDLIMNPFKPHEEQLKIFSDQDDTKEYIRP